MMSPRSGSGVAQVSAATDGSLVVRTADGVAVLATLATLAAGAPAGLLALLEQPARASAAVTSTIIRRMINPLYLSAHSTIGPPGGVYCSLASFAPVGTSNVMNPDWVSPAATDTPVTTSSSGPADVGHSACTSIA